MISVLSMALVEEEAALAALQPATGPGTDRQPRRRPESVVPSGGALHGERAC
jgi:hypothetical protein